MNDIEKTQEMTAAEDFGAMLDEAELSIHTGQVVKSMVQQVADDEVIVSIPGCKADGMIKQAQQEADQLTADVKGRMETLEARYEALKASATSFKADFSRILEQQQAALRESNGLF